MESQSHPKFVLEDLMHEPEMKFYEHQDQSQYLTVE
jgi:hypothetical protein